jgi:hypothetical protein
MAYVGCEVKFNQIHLSKKPSIDQEIKNLLYKQKNACDTHHAFLRLKKPMQLESRLT